MDGLVIVIENKPFTTSIEIAKGVDHSHTSVLKLIKNSMDLEMFRDLKVLKISTKGRPSDMFYLDEEQATLLIALMKNTPIVREFKQKLITEFYKLKRALIKIQISKQGAEYQLMRSEGKQIRLEETDWIKAFVNYATDQGSKSAHRYYSNISTMENKALFMLDQKVKNVRELLDMKQLSLVRVADMAVVEAIKEGIEEKLHYKEIYQKAKERVEMLSKVIPRSPLAFLALENA